MIETNFNIGDKIVIPDYYNTPEIFTIVAINPTQAILVSSNFVRWNNNVINKHCEITTGELREYIGSAGVYHDWYPLE